MTDRKLLMNTEEERSGRNRPKTIAWAIARALILLGCLYFFIISLDLMSSAFRLIAGKTAADALGSNVILSNPIAGLMIGMLVTALVQSSSTSTSIFISMVSAKILTVRQAVPLVMGANIGTSITGTLVALTQASNKENFSRAFSCSMLNDMFNKLSVLVLLPIEIAFHYLEETTKLVVDGIFGPDSNQLNQTAKAEVEILNAITKPFSKLIIQLDKDVLDKIAINNASTNATLIKYKCSSEVNGTKVYEDCKFLLNGLDSWPEWAVGILLLALSLITLCGCLILMVNVLTSVFKGKVAELVQKNLNSDFPGYWRYLNGIVSICIGCGLTVIIQSSSVFISTLVPLVGIGLVDLERVFPLALGANIGTTITGILAAFSSPGDRLKDSLQIAFCHTLFNISGILIWYPVPYLRKAPLWLSVTLGKICGQYRWFAIFYILFVFGFTPMVTFGLSLAGLEVFLSVLVPLLLLISFIVVVNVLQEKKPSWIFPSELRTWEFLPKWMRSLQPYDHFVTTYVFCCKCGQPSGVAPIDEADDAIKEIVTMKELEARENEYNEKNEYKF